MVEDEYIVANSRAGSLLNESIYFSPVISMVSDPPDLALFFERYLYSFFLEYEHLL